jgi:hypothetical protein
MNGATPLRPLNAFMRWTGTILPFLLFTINCYVLLLTFLWQWQRLQKISSDLKRNLKNIESIIFSTCMACRLIKLQNPRWTISENKEAYVVEYFYESTAQIVLWLLTVEVLGLHALRYTTLCRSPMGERSVRRRELYLTTHNNYNRQTFMTPVGYEPAIPAAERKQTYALERAATRICKMQSIYPLELFI